METTANRNLKYLQDIDNYYSAHEKDFKQVFFKPDAEHIKSADVGVFVKDIYGVDQVNPVTRIPGYHTRNSCELNTAIYANSVIDYNSPKNYVPGANEVKVDGDFANSPNYFLTAKPASGETFSVEISGYIAAQKPGTYRVSANAIAFFKKNALIWVGNNALKTFRKENAQFIVENGSQIKNAGVSMVTGEYTPFRIQYSGNTQFDYKTQPIWVNGDGYPISVFAKNANENNLHYYSLSPSDKTNYYNCDVYKGSELQKYKTDAKQQFLKVWQMPLDERTECIFLGMNGRLRAYDSNYEKIGEPIFSNNNNRNNQLANRNYKLELYQRKLNPLCIRNPDNTVVPLITIPDLNTIRNEEWAQTQKPMVKTMTNQEEQVGDKRISIDRITEINPLFSEDFRYKLCIMKDRDQKKILALIASTSPSSQFYTAEPDLKMNKLFYASTYLENKFLREVPANLQVNSNTYTTYGDTYPLPTGYTETASSETNTCETQCNADVGCNHFYKVTDSTNVTKCFISKNPVSTFLPKQPDSSYASSELNVKNKMIQTGDTTKDAIYNKTQYLPDGYSDSVNLRFADFPVERKVLSESDTPGPDGTSYVVELKNKISQSTNGTSTSVTNVNNPMIAGKLENFTTVVNDSLTKLNEIETKITQYEKDQKKIGENRGKIKNNLTSIEKTYLDMSGNQQKYDFTGQTIYALEEDDSLAAALLKDNALYKAEQNNLFLVTTLAMATFLVTAILISK